MIITNTKSQYYYNLKEPKTYTLSLIAVSVPMIYPLHNINAKICIFLIIIYFQSTAYLHLLWIVLNHQMSTSFFEVVKILELI